MWDRTGLGSLPVASEVVQAALHHKLSSSSVLSGPQQLLLPLLFAPVSALLEDVWRQFNEQFVGLMVFVLVSVFVRTKYTAAIS